MTKSRKGFMTLEEHHAQLKAEGKWDAYVAQKKKQHDDAAKKRADLAAAEAPVVEDLRRIGLDVHSVWDLVNTNKAYPDAIPVLFEHLRIAYPDLVKEGIVRALAVPEARSGWADLLEIFKSAPEKASGGIRWAAASALGASADDSVMDEVIRIVTDQSYGFDRAGFLIALKRTKSARAKMVLNELRSDPVIGKEVKKALRGK